MHGTDDAKGWRPAKDLRFARNLEAIALAVEEIPRVAQSHPVAFVSGAKGWRAMATFGPGDGINRFVLEPSWAWRGHYIPALMRAYPFMLEPKDEGSIRLWPGVAPEPVEEDVLPFFENGEASERVRQIFGFLRQVHAGMSNVQPALALLEEHKLLVPWSRFEGQEMVLGDQKLYVLDAEAFGDLAADLFLQLRDLQALPWLYAHLHSLHHSRIFDSPDYAPADMVDVGSVYATNQINENADLEILTALSEDLGDFEL